jgi:hypothetical protein
MAHRDPYYTFCKSCPNDGKLKENFLFTPRELLQANPQCRECSKRQSRQWRDTWGRGRNVKPTTS